ncbi:MAG: hypothetical protein ISR77_06010 [Pirellulaceae bacterium]|nr:hypothetical protein [Pirellulaceae bacterium]
MQQEAEIPQKPSATEALGTRVGSFDGSQNGHGSRFFALEIVVLVAGQELLTLSGYDNYVRSVSFSPDGLRIASGGNDDTVRVWDARPWQRPIETAPAPPNP